MLSYPSQNPQISPQNPSKSNIDNNKDSSAPKKSSKNKKDENRSKDPSSTLNSSTNQGKNKSKSNKNPKHEKDKNTDNTHENLESASDANFILKEIKPNPLDFDKTLVSYFNDIDNLITYKHTMEEQVKIIGEYVCQCMGGKVCYDTVDHIEWQVHQSEKKLKYNSNVIPIGDIQLGTFTHRALLFKALSDKIGLSVSLNRGNYNRAWNEIVLPDNGIHKPFVIDLMFKPGEIFRGDCIGAEKYKRL